MNDKSTTKPVNKRIDSDCVIIIYCAMAPLWLISLCKIYKRRAWGLYIHALHAQLSRFPNPKDKKAYYIYLYIHNHLTIIY
uniref:Uncharacterized protein n=1 Tax=virus sp. ctCsQ3 TaxID=2826794 RepID=A0A8S5R632_9VIRU|nr:MAG TPA: hypothetical protein [virus sp. ctCsQ3]